MAVDTLPNEYPSTADPCTMDASCHAFMTRLEVVAVPTAKTPVTHRQFVAGLWDRLERTCVFRSA
jgi:hypothetical protein